MQDKNRDFWQIPLDGTFDVRNYEPRREKDRELREAARKMKANEVSPVIKTSDGFHIIKLREYSPERQLTFEEVKVYLENKLRVPAQDKRLREWEQELRKDAKIEILNGEGK
jgi:parvulin-like peptidyl-prolyl isomerase